MDIWKLMEERHSVRQYTDQPISPDLQKKIRALVEEVNQESGLDIQVLFDEPTCFDSARARYGKFSGVRNYLALIGPGSPDLDEKLGFWGEKIVLGLQEMGLNSCWVALTHGKSKAVIKSGEKQRCLICFGYGETEGHPHRNKSAAELSDVSNLTPEWFNKGVRAAMLAPTAINQQKFFIGYKDGEVSFKKGNSFYTGMDLGIVKYHFELGSGRKVTD